MKILYSFFLLLLLSGGQAFAQSTVTFANRVNTSTPVNFSVGGVASGDPSTSNYVPVPASSNTLNYQFTLYRTKGSASKGYVLIFTSTSASNFNKPELAKVTVTGTWMPIYYTSGGISNEETISFNGSLTLSSSQAAGNSGIYAVYINTLVTPEQQVEVTAPVRLGAPLVNNPSPAPSGTPKPLNYYIPCAGTEICPDQCIPYNTRPSKILGRVLAIDSQDFTDYAHLPNNVPFAKATEYESVVWQVSYTNDGSDWQDISGENKASYQPPVCTKTTYYRRSSTHSLESWWRPGYLIDHWYDSNTVTITPTAPSPTLVQSAYTTCGSGNTKVFINPAPTAVSYNWWVPYAGWAVSNDGTNPYSTYNNGSSFVTTNTSVFITLPNGVAAGDYEIRTSANSLCGPKSADAVIIIHVVPGTNPVARPLGYSLERIIDGCQTTFNVTTAQVVNATAYEASFEGYVMQGFVNSSNRIEFDFLFSGSTSGPMTITAIGPCNSETASFNLKTPFVKACAERVASSDNPSALTMYPNPATAQVTLGSVDHEATANFYDTQGVLRKATTLKSQNGQTTVDVKDLLPGLYHVRILSEGKLLLEKQLLIQQ